MQLKLISVLITSFVLVIFVYAGIDDNQDIQGSWIPVSAEMSGKKVPDQVLKTMKFVLADGKYTIKNGDLADLGTYKLDQNAKPRAIDMTCTEGLNQGNTIQAIYELSGDTLKICYDTTGDDRPSEFKSLAGTQLFLVTYKREKK